MTTKMEKLQAREKELLDQIKETKRLSGILQDQIKRDQVEMPVIPQGKELEEDLAAARRFLAAVEAAKAKDPGTDIEEMVACRSPEMLQVVKDMARYKELIFVYVSSNFLGSLVHVLTLWSALAHRARRRQPDHSPPTSWTRQATQHRSGRDARQRLHQPRVLPSALVRS